MNEVFTYYIDLPPSVKGVVQPDANGDYTIYINAIYNEEQRQEIFRHEMRHILLGHHHAGQPVAEAEHQAQDEALLPKSIERAAMYGVPLRGAILPEELPAQEPAATAAPPPPAAAQAAPAPPVPEEPAYGTDEYYKKVLEQIRRQVQTGLYY